MKSANIFFMVLMLLVAGCRREVTIDASSPDRFWLSVRSITAQLPREEGADFQFAIVKLRKQGYTEEQLAQMGEPPLDAGFLQAIDKKTAHEVIALARKLPDAVPLSATDEPSKEVDQHHR